MPNGAIDKSVDGSITLISRESATPAPNSTPNLNDQSPTQAALGNRAGSALDTAQLPGQSRALQEANLTMFALHQLSQSAGFGLVPEPLNQAPASSNHSKTLRTVGTKRQANPSIFPEPIRKCLLHIKRSDVQAVAQHYTFENIHRLEPAERLKLTIVKQLADAVRNVSFEDGAIDFALIICLNKIRTLLKDWSDYRVKFMNRFQPTAVENPIVDYINLVAPLLEQDSRCKPFLKALKAAYQFQIAPQNKNALQNALIANTALLRSHQKTPAMHQNTARAGNKNPASSIHPSNPKRARLVPRATENP